MFDPNWDPYDRLRNHELRILGLENKVNELIEINNEQADFILELAKQNKQITKLQTALTKEVAQIKQLLERL